MRRTIIWIVPALLLFLTACTKQAVVGPPIDESLWLTKERGIVAFSDFNCDYYIVETQRGFTLMRSWGGSAPFEGSVLYGDFSSWGMRTFYNRSRGYLLSADVRDYWLSYWQAQDGIEWNCRPQFP